ncbi:DICT sensory domain-containing protein [Planktothrix agardhii]|jgi:DICT domain-containing protein/signal transduction histidine kinase|uniref:histidine kinase n=1 Tax=Planktothrix agardhii TaxID=1160 RepID=A0AAD1Q6H7_PLAAG|nr:DICT sensory domain-containing protein [Planktothrix agardhii]BBD56957.1 two-component sensor histidine kinase [Planktothrix agardhii NIES-204]MBG0745392.1 GAF domain-containing protein [Planktothrix agardhii KL2]MCB8752939.1 GAF domain-containing protein [Planktothrix agardhii 1810]MCB8764347.1 GAF domain-containing protein [Planktothrix agardhii 1809]MCB8782401.1 GAF domain-containing protein [Planktothrix agardhii 1808]
MSVSTSVLTELVQFLPSLKPQIYFKSSLTALSHAMEDQVLATTEQPLVIATFQQERFYRQEAHRYRKIAAITPQVYVMAAEKTEFQNSSDIHETVAFDPQDKLSQEWNLLVLGQYYATCLVCVEREDLVQNSDITEKLLMDQARPFEGIWTSDRQVSIKVAELLLERTLYYRPELAEKVEQAFLFYNIRSATKKSKKSSNRTKSNSSSSDYSSLNDPFAYRLVTYLQAGQHKLLRVYRSLAAKERKERLVNSITSTIRQSLNPQEVIKVATHELGEAMGACRCLIYRCKATDNSVKISNEYLCNDVVSIIGKTWLLRENPLFQEVVKRQEPIYINQTDEIDIDWLNNNNNNSVKSQESLKKITQKLEIKGWLMIPILYQGQLLGMVELHQCNCNLSEWQEDDLLMVDAIATQLGAAIIQAETYANLEDLNQQLEALERTRSNLIAITGHELRTPLSTILICLESLNQEPDMPVEMRKVMLDTALEDAERLRKLVQDFLKLSHLESGRVDWNPESLRLKECIDLAISGIRTHHNQNQVPAIQTEVPSNLPLVQADGEWLVELLSKLLDNACKFTNSDGKVKINAKCNGDQMMEVTISDTGRGIEPNRLDAVFERFYQEEGSLRRSVGGTGLGLAISRQIVNGWGGEIWADSQGKNQGSQFHFTIPYVESDS